MVSPFEFGTARPTANLLTQCPLWYVSPTQIKAILSSSLIAGQYYVSVALGSSETGRMAIVATDGRFAAFSQGGQGFGPAVIQQYDAVDGPSLNKLTAAARPGMAMVLWGTGLGASSRVPTRLRRKRERFGMMSLSTWTGFRRYPFTPAVHLDSQEWTRINFTLPSDVKQRCFVPLQVATGNVIAQS